MFNDRSGSRDSSLNLHYSSHRGFTHGSRRGFTVVEVLVAVAILGMLIYGLYTLFSRTVSSVDVGTWTSQTQVKMRNAIKQLSKDISAATYKSLMTSKEAKVFRDDKYKIKFKSGAVDTKTTQADLLNFTICTPGKQGLREADEQAKVVRVMLKSEKTADNRPKLTYVKTVDTADGRDSDASKGDNVADDKKNMTLLEDVIKFEARLIDSPNNVVNNNTNMADDTKGLRSLRIEIECAHPSYPKTRHLEGIEVPIYVDALPAL